MSDTMPPPPPPPASTPAPPSTGGRSATSEVRTPGFFDAVRSELTKLRTGRAPIRNLVLGTVLSIGLSALIAFGVGATFSDWDRSDQLEFEPTLLAVAGSFLAIIFFIAVGSRVATSEYSSGMIRLTLTVTPRRDRILFAKALVVAIATWIAGAATFVGMVVVTQVIFAAFDVGTASLTSTTTLRTVGLLVLLTPLFPVLAVCAGIVFRGTAATLTVVLALLFGPGVFGMLLPTWWRDNVVSLMPGQASDSLTIGHLTDSALYPDTLPAVFAVVGWLVVALLGARIVLVRRDA